MGTPSELRESLKICFQRVPFFRKMLHVVHETAQLPPRCERGDTRFAILDMSDAGELGYEYGHNPITLQKLKQTMYEVLVAPGGLRKPGEGNFDYWDRVIDTESRQLVILGDPMRMCTLHEFAVGERAYNITKLEETLRSFVRNYLMKKAKYEEVWILCGPRLSTALGRCIDKI